MALDMKKMKERLARVESKEKEGEKKEKLFWSPVKDQDTDIRIVPVKSGDPFKEFFTHYLEIDEKHKKSVLCPKKNFGDSCPICDLVAKLYKDGAEENIKEAKNLLAKVRYYSPVLVRGQEEEGIKIWGYPKGIYQSILGLINNPEYGDITDVNDGLDLTVTTKKVAGKKFPEPFMTPRRKASPLSADKEVMKSVLETDIDLDTLFERRTTSEAAVMLDEYLKGGVEEGGDEPVGTADESDDVEAALNRAGI